MTREGKSGEANSGDASGGTTKQRGEVTLMRIMAEASCGFATRLPVIKRIEERTGRRMILYTAALSGPAPAIIDLNDIPPLVDILSMIDPDEPLDFMITSVGGMPHVARKILLLLRGTKKRALRFIVPIYAKSAATLLCLGGDSIVMGDTSELGPIDPQVTKWGPFQEPRHGSAHSFIDSYEKLVEKVNESGLTPAAVALLAAVDLAFVETCQKAVDEARELASELLLISMLKDRPEEARRVAEALSTPSGSHGEMISHARAASEYALKVEYLPQDHELWKLLWELYIRSDMYLRSSRKLKLLESADSSISIGAGHIRE